MHQSSFTVYLCPPDGEYHVTEEPLKAGTDEYLRISDQNGSAVYLKVTDSLKEQLSRICQEWAFESEARGRKLAGKKL